MIIVNYTQSGEAIPDFKAEQFVKDLNEKRNCRCDVSTENVIHAVRALVHEQFLNIEDVQIQHEGTPVIMLSKRGRFENNPVGFCDTYEGFLDRILDL